MQILLIRDKCIFIFSIMRTNIGGTKANNEEFCKIRIISTV